MSHDSNHNNNNNNDSLYWTCHVCTVDQNPILKRRCIVCNARRSVEAIQTTLPTTTSTSSTTAHVKSTSKTINDKTSIISRSNTTTTTTTNIDGMHSTQNDNTPNRDDHCINSSVTSTSSCSSSSSTSSAMEIETIEQPQQHLIYNDNQNINISVNHDNDMIDGSPSIPPPGGMVDDESIVVPMMNVQQQQQQESNASAETIVVSKNATYKKYNKSNNINNWIRTRKQKRKRQEKVFVEQVRECEEPNNNAITTTTTTSRMEQQNVGYENLLLQQQNVILNEYHVPPYNDTTTHVSSSSSSSSSTSKANDTNKNKSINNEDRHDDSSSSNSSSFVVDNHAIKPNKDNGTHDEKYCSYSKTTSTCDIDTSKNHDTLATTQITSAATTNIHNDRDIHCSDCLTKTTTAIAPLDMVVQKQRLELTVATSDRDSVTTTTTTTAHNNITSTHHNDSISNPDISSSSTLLLLSQPPLEEVKEQLDDYCSRSCCTDHVDSCNVATTVSNKNNNTTISQSSAIILEEDNFFYTPPFTMMTQSLSQTIMSQQQQQQPPLTMSSPQEGNHNSKWKNRNDNTKDTTALPNKKTLGNVNQPSKSGSSDLQFVKESNITMGEQYDDNSRMTNDIETHTMSRNNEQHHQPQQESSDTIDVEVGRMNGMWSANTAELPSIGPDSCSNPDTEQNVRNCAHDLDSTTKNIDKRDADILSPTNTISIESDSIDRRDDDSSRITQNIMDGFRTAGFRTKINVSSDALLNANRILASDSNGIETLLPSKSTVESNTNIQHNSIAFQTAGFGKKINISTDALQNANRMFASDSKDVETMLPSKTTFESNTTDKHNLIGFQTAGLGKNINVSSDALLNANRIVASYSDGIETLLPSKSTVESNTNGQHNSIGFQTAGFGKKINISMEALQNASRMFASDSNVVETMLLPKSTVESNKITHHKISGFQTAGFGKKINISTEALQHANRIIASASNVVEKFPQSCSNNDDSSTIAIAQHTMSCVLTESSGNEINIAAEAFHNANRMVASDVDVIETMIPSKYNVESNTFKQHKMDGFQTAGFGKKINISAYALQNANRIITSDSNVLETKPQPCYDDDSSATKTASVETKINLNVDAIKNDTLVMAVDADKNEASPSSSVDDESRLITQTYGFQTAGFGNKIIVSAHALHNANRVLESAENVKEVPPTNIKLQMTPKTSICGFQTAGVGNKIHISSDAINNANHILSSNVSELISPFSNNEANTTPQNVSGGFRTAGFGNKIDVSVDALNNANLMFASNSNNVEVCPPSIEGDELKVKVNNHNTKGEFQTAGFGKEISFTADELCNASIIFDSDASAVETIPPAKYNEKSIVVTQCIRDGLQKAGFGNKVDIETNKQRNDNRIFDSTVDVEERYFEEPVPRSCMNSFSDSRIVNGITSSPENLPRGNFLTECDNFDTRLPVDGGNKGLDSNINAQDPSNSSFTKVKTCNGTSCEAFCLSENVDFSPCSWKPRVTFSDVKEAKMHHLSATPGPQKDLSSSFMDGAFVTPGSCINDGDEDCDSSSFMSPQLSLQDTVRKGLLVSSVSQALYHGVSSTTIEVDSENACLLRFDRNTFQPEAFLFDGSQGSSNLVGSLTDYTLALKSLGCDFSRISDNWLVIHIRWITWKLASMERRFAIHLAGRCLTFKAVANQLKHRYEKEIQGGAVSSIRKILRRDISSRCLFIFFVARIKRHEFSNSAVDANGNKLTEISFLLELSDGWYSLPAAPDSNLCDFISKGKIIVGTKLLVSNSLLSGFDDGIDPLDNSFDPFNPQQSPVLHIYTNSTRLAHWNAKLGLVTRVSSSSIDGILKVNRISDVYDNGGRVPLIDLKVLRVFPLSYLDRQTNETGRSRILTESEEIVRMEQYEKQRQKLIDQLSDEVLIQCEADVDEEAPLSWKKMAQDVLGSDYECLDDDTKLEISRWSTQRVGLIQTRMHQEIECRLEELEMEEAIPSKPFVRVNVSSVIRRSDNSFVVSDSEEACLTIWEPSNEQLDSLVEETTIRVKNIDAKNSRFDGRKQFVGGPGTAILPLHTTKSPTCFDFKSQRNYVSFCSLQLQSKSYWKDSIQESRVIRNSVTLIGVLLHARTDENHYDRLIYITDTSQLIVRIHCVHICAKLDRLLVDSLYSNAPIVIEFGNVAVMPFDRIENCSVAKYCKESTFSLSQFSKRVENLQEWSRSDIGSHCYRKLRAYLDVGVNELINVRSRHTKRIGYLAGFYVLPNIPQLIVKVDCGSSYLHTWRFPLSLISSFTEAINVINTFKDVALNDDEESQLSKLTKIGNIFAARKTLFCFTLRTTSSTVNNEFKRCESEVIQITAIDATKLVTLYLMNTIKSQSVCD